MKAITLTQPFATLVAIRAKKIETRSWGTGYRGPLATHAAKGLNGLGEMGLRPNLAGLADICNKEPFRSILMNHFGPEFAATDLPLGRVVAVTSVIDCLEMTPEWIVTIPRLERSFGFYEPGRFGWVLGPVTPCAIPARGAMGLWDWEPGDKPTELPAKTER